MEPTRGASRLATPQRTRPEDAVLRRVNVDGGAVETLATGLEDAFAVTVDDTYAYTATDLLWADRMPLAA